MSDGERSDGGIRGAKAFLVALPVCLFFSIIGAVWFHWHRENREEANPALAMSGQGMDRDEVEDLAKKLGWLSTEG